MKKLTTDIFENPLYEAPDLIELLYQGFEHIEKLNVVNHTPDIISFNELADIHINQYIIPDSSIEDYDALMQSNWFMPDVYKNLDIEDYLISLCMDKSEHEQERVAFELVEYQKRNLFNLLRWLKYFVDTARENNIIWGVGRGSSVSSYVLYLMGIHKIDSVKYELDYTEFFKGD